MRWKCPRWEKKNNWHLSFILFFPLTCRQGSNFSPNSIAKLIVFQNVSDKKKNQTLKFSGFFSPPTRYLSPIEYTENGLRVKIHTPNKSKVNIDNQLLVTNTPYLTNYASSAQCGQSTYIYACKNLKTIRLSEIIKTNRGNKLSRIRTSENWFTDFHVPGIHNPSGPVGIQQEIAGNSGK